MAPLKEYAVLESGQEVLDKVAASISNPRKTSVALTLKSADGKTKDVRFDVNTFGRDSLGDLIVGYTIDGRPETINVSVLTGNGVIARMRS